MAGAKKTFQKLKSKSYLQKRFDPAGISEGKLNLDPTSKKFDQSFANPGAVLGATAEDAGELFTPDIPIPDEIPIIPIPDEETAAVEARKRRAKTVGTGRESTILTEGLGG